ncbi:hypothetical protein ACTG9Q_29865 [Actinokineospora sp. 24-640]
MSDIPEGRLRRRAFVTLAATTAALAAVGRTAAASPASSMTAASPLIDRAAGPVGDRVLALSSQDWLLADASGATTATRGLEGADVVAVTAGPGGYVAVGSRDGVAVIWESADGVAWTSAARRNELDAAFTAVGAGPGGVLALGSLLSAERTPRRAVAAFRTASRDWLTVPVRGLGRADQLAITAVTGTADGWTAAAVDLAGTALFHSPTGASWSEGTRVTATAVRELVGQRWEGNALDDTAPVRGVIGGDRTVVDVPRDAHAVGGNFWLTQGTLVRGTR